MTRTAFNLLGTALILAGSVVFGFGVPVFWLWVGSLIQGGLNPSFGAVVTVLAGMTLSYFAFVAMMARFGGTAQSLAEGGRRRDAWSRSLRDERRVVTGPTDWVESLVIVTVLLVAVVCTVWFFLYGSPGVPLA